MMERLAQIVDEIEAWRGKHWELPSDYPARFYAVRDMMVRIFRLQSAILEEKAEAFQQYDAFDYSEGTEGILTRMRARALHRTLINAVESVIETIPQGSPDAVTFETFSATHKQLRMYHELYG